MTINLGQWQQKLGELGKQKTANAEDFKKLNFPTPEQIAHYELTNVQIQREINSHLQTLDTSISHDVETLGKLSAILDYGNTAEHNKNDVFNQMSVEELAAYRNELSENYDLAFDLLTKSKDALEDVTLSYRDTESGKIYSANPAINSEQFDTSTITGQVNDFLLNTEAGRQVSSTLGKIQNQVEDSVFKQIVAEIIIGKSPSKVIEIIKKSFVDSEITKEDIIDVTEKLSSEDFPNLNAKDAFKVIDMLSDTIKESPPSFDKNPTTPLSFEEFIQENHISFAQTDTLGIQKTIDNVLPSEFYSAESLKKYEEYLTNFEANKQTNESTTQPETTDLEQQNWDEHADVVLDDMENQEFIDESLADIEQETTQEAYDQAWEEEADLRLDQIEDEFKSLDKESVVPPIQNTLATQASSAGFKQWFNLTVQEDWNDEQWEKQLIGSTIDTSASAIQELIISDGASFEQLSSTFQGNLQSSGSSLVAGYIVNDALGIEFGSDLGGQVMSTVVGHTSSSAVQAAYTAATSTTSFSDAFVGAFSSSSNATSTEELLKYAA